MGEPLLREGFRRSRDNCIAVAPTQRMILALVLSIALAAPLSPNEAGARGAREARAIRIACAQTNIKFYVSEREFREHIASRLAAAMQGNPDLIVFPEHIGTGLVALGASPSVQAAQSLEEVMPALLEVCGEKVQRVMARAQVSVRRALLIAQAGVMHRVYCETFSGLAREHAVHLASGTIALPHEKEGTGSSVYNTFFLFGPQGTLLGTAHKVDLIPLELEEGLDLTAADAGSLKPWQTALGSFGPVVCADGWDRELVSSLVHRGARLLLNPSANPEPWTPAVAADRQEGLFARVRECGVPGVECFAVGTLAGLRFEGVSRVLVPDPRAPAGVTILAQARTPTEEEIVFADVELPAQ